jgi:hypothetical protein
VGGSSVTSLRSIPIGNNKADFNLTLACLSYIFL